MPQNVEPTSVSQPVRPQVDLDVVAGYWRDVCRLTADLDEQTLLKPGEAAAYLNQHRPQDCSPFTVARLSTFERRHITDPIDKWGGPLRTHSKLTPKDVRRALLAQILLDLLKTDEEKEDFGRVAAHITDFEQLRATNRRWLDRPHGELEQDESPPSSVGSAYHLLRNRVLGTLTAALGETRAGDPPDEYLIALRVLQVRAEAQVAQTLTWDRAQEFLKNKDLGWHLAAGFPKLYLYGDLEDFLRKQPEMEPALKHYRWHTVPFWDSEAGQAYQVLLGLPDNGLRDPKCQAIESTLAELEAIGGVFSLQGCLGLSTLLRATFVNLPSREGTTVLAVLAEIIARASDAWDYCVVLTPDSSDRRWLCIQEFSSAFPSSRLAGKRVEIGQFISGWCFEYGHPVVLNATVTGDPRIAYYDDERPTSALAAPAVCIRDGRPESVGVVYVARARPLPGPASSEPLFSQELIGALEMFGVVCGDVIARDDVETGSVHQMVHLSAQEPEPCRSFADLDNLLVELVAALERELAPEAVQHAWVHLLTVQVQGQTHVDPRLEAVSQWHSHQVAEVTTHFLTRLGGSVLRKASAPIGRCETERGQFVFAILEPVLLSEETYKAQLIRLQHQLAHMRIPGVAVGVYPWGVSYRYARLRSDLSATGGGPKYLVGHLLRRLGDALRTGPYISRGHDALRENRSDDAVREFRDALLHAPESPYLHKHLAEAYMLKGLFPQAIEYCRKAIAEDYKYASAHCLLADCLSYQGQYKEAREAYELAIGLNRSRQDFLIRYGIALAGIATPDYQRLFADRIKDRTVQPLPYQAAIEQLESAQSRYAESDDTEEGKRRRLSEYRYFRGLAYLQADQMDEAVEELAAGRRLAPDDLRLAQVHAYALSRQRDKQGRG